MTVGTPLFIDGAASVLGFLLERREHLELTRLVALRRFVYRQVMCSVDVRRRVSP